MIDEIGVICSDEFYDRARRGPIDLASLQMKPTPKTIRLRSTFHDRWAVYSVDDNGWTVYPPIISHDPCELPVNPILARDRKIDELREVLLAYEQWEAKLLDCDGFNLLDIMPTELYDEMMRIQAKRNEVLGR